VAKHSGEIARRPSDPQNSTIPISAALPPPSTENLKWWDTHQPREVPPVSGPNPFYDFDSDNNVKAPSIGRQPLINLLD
jgi:hypothetical protein